MTAALMIVLLSATGAEAQEEPEPHAWRVGVEVGPGGTPGESEVIEQLGSAEFDREATLDASLAAEWWPASSVGVGVGLRWHRLTLSRHDAESRFDTFSLLVLGIAAGRPGAAAQFVEAGVDLAVGPAIVRWEHRGETVSALGLTTRLGARLGQGLPFGFVWSIRPWIGTTWSAIGPQDLSTAGISAGVDLYVGWGTP